MDEREKNINGSDGDEYDKVCYVCRRPESKAGKMITLPGRHRYLPGLYAEGL